MGAEAKAKGPKAEAGTADSEAQHMKPRAITGMQKTISIYGNN